ncbi:SMP-30/gluconolactonase/LRE family protein [Lyngbya confervoides]|uniref:SMP-30/gluconolactonase/LRE family protein n=1 Tax=Lyngbya confervoides BDU141951 TaxID=1574623 RepID=A0ABD4T2I5_9CYAN|nr:SMP-30/gluconolactonase/LRE family protein [Lyngbya confervoides]MCM1982831.1 SMP-30/gluconolactonase/LRE family protein [Lyngbya confervoides BDU141951]
MSDLIHAYNSQIYDLVSAHATLHKLASNAQHSEGPVYVPADNSVIWSDVSGNRLLRWSPEDGVRTIRTPSHYQNGNALDREGRLVSCSHGQRAILRREPSGEWKVLVDRYQGNRLNSPNDLVVKQDGSIWFSDPPFGLTQPKEGYGGAQEQAGSFVYRFDPETGSITAVIQEMERPNGLAFSPDEKTLYVSDTSQVNYPQGHHYIRAYEVIEGKSVGNAHVFAVINPGQPDGIKVHRWGHLFTTSADSIQIYTPTGLCLGKIRVPEVCTNLTFGGTEGKHLFITAGRSLYAIEMRG